ncbi:unnamed protein product [Prunus armeniaca]|uniref:Uncharacterized protein n=1 Tax=Prunus armeniaca TaxID=36596 RepID=A0A6J5Y0Z4_PRUAR|nr:unnamed protein product [Prunus armeniaca]CAB4317084.1 unnamed protein product [Prunus armeniaca]
MTRGRLYIDLGGWTGSHTPSDPTWFGPHTWMIRTNIRVWFQSACCGVRQLLLLSKLLSGGLLAILSSAAPQVGWTSGWMLTQKS